MQNIRVEDKIDKKHFYSCTSYQQEYVSIDAPSNWQLRYERCKTKQVGIRIINERISFIIFRTYLFRPRLATPMLPLTRSWPSHSPVRCHRPQSTPSKWCWTSCRCPALMAPQKLAAADQMQNKIM